jgi:DnaJ-class molecular chaperone
MTLADATDDEIVQELKRRLEVSCPNCNGFGYRTINSGNTNEYKDICQLCDGNGKSINFKRALEIKHAI